MTDDLCQSCGHSKKEHVGGQYDCDYGNCSCIEFEPSPDPAYRWRVRRGKEDSC